MDFFDPILLLIIAAFAAVWLKFNNRRTQDIVSPFNFLLFSWFGPLLLRGLHLSVLERPWSIGTSLAVGFSSVMLLLPCLIMNRPPEFKQPRQQEIFRNQLLPV